MAILQDTRDAIFTIELPDGRTYTGAAMATEIRMERPIGAAYLAGDDVRAFRPGVCTWEIELRGIGPLTAFDNLKGAIEASERSIDWTCPYCGRTWLRSQHKCWDGFNGCGANRPAMWWVKHNGI